MLRASGLAKASEKEIGSLWVYRAQAPIEDRLGELVVVTPGDIQGQAWALAEKAAKIFSGPIVL